MKSIRIGYNLVVQSVGDAVPALIKEQIIVGERLDLSKILSSDDQHQVATFLRWFLESDKEFLNLTSHYLSDKDHCTLSFHRESDGVTLRLSEKDVVVDDETAKKIFFWDNFINCFDQGVLYMKPSGKIEFSSKETPAMFPLIDPCGVMYSSEGLINKNIFDFINPEISSELRSFIDRAQTNRASRFAKVFEGEKKTIRIVSYPIYTELELKSVVLLVFDITEKENAKKQLRIAEDAIQSKSHLVALGEVAASIAHEINTPLCALNLNISMLKRSVENSDTQRVETTLVRMKSTVDLVAKIVNNLLNLARSNQEDLDDFESIQLIDVVEEMMPLLKRNILDAGARLKVEVSDQVLFDAKRVQFQQVLLNMIKNSIQAVSSLPVDERWVRVFSKDDGHNVSIFIEDSGPGICDEVLSKINEPFFSTKQAGEGTGLGLSISQSIIKSHGGILRYCGDKNTCFEIIIPKSQGVRHAV